MWYKWTTFEWQEFPMVLVSTIIVFAAILLYTRIVGLRSFSKMSSADFAMTVAIGSLFASTISSAKPTLVLGLVALASLYAGQWAVARLRRKFKWFGKLIDNDPLLLMCGGEYLDENLERANVTRADIQGKLREANAFSTDAVLAVVFETTGDISVLHSRDSNAQLDPEIMKEVVGASQLFAS